MTEMSSLFAIMNGLFQQTLKRIFLIVATVVSATVAAQAQDGPRLSIDVGITSYESKTSIKDILDPLGYSDIVRWKVYETLEAPHIGANLHFKQWIFGVEKQSDLLYEVDVYRAENPNVDQIGTAYSWWSLHAERSFAWDENFRPFIAVGGTHAKVNAFLRIQGKVTRTSVTESEPFVRVGLSYHIKKVQLRADFTKRFTESDIPSLLRLSMRVPLKT